MADRVCERPGCGHFARWHSFHGLGDCEHDGSCTCEAFLSEAAEPTDDEVYNRPGVEGGIPYRTEPSMEDLLREKGDL